jgi:hypothetical protein
MAIGFAQMFEVRFPENFDSALPVPRLHSVLAQMAHDAFILFAGLFVYFRLEGTVVASRAAT